MFSIGRAERLFWSPSGLQLIYPLDGGGGDGDPHESDALCHRGNNSNLMEISGYRDEFAELRIATDRHARIIETTARQTWSFLRSTSNYSVFGTKPTSWLYCCCCCWHCSGFWIWKKNRCVSDNTTFFLQRRMSWSQGLARTRSLASTKTCWPSNMKSASRMGNECLPQFVFTQSQKSSFLISQDLTSCCYANTQLEVSVFWNRRALRDWK